MLGRNNSIAPDEPPMEVRKQRSLAPLTPAAIPDDPPEIRSRFYIAQNGSERRYYTDYQQKHLAITADGNKIRTTANDRETIAAMISLAEARGWYWIRVKGSQDFKREAWVQANVRGLVVNGYQPTETDSRNSNRRIAAEGPPAETRQAQPPSPEVRLIDVGRWNPADSGAEQRVIVGQSAAGFHAAVQKSMGGADPGAPEWSKAYPTMQEAKAAVRGVETAAASGGGTTCSSGSRRSARRQMRLPREPKRKGSRHDDQRRSGPPGADAAAAGG